MIYLPSQRLPVIVNSVIVSEPAVAECMIYFTVVDNVTNSISHSIMAVYSQV